MAKTANKLTLQGNYANVIVNNNNSVAWERSNLLTSYDWLFTIFGCQKRPPHPRPVNYFLSINRLECLYRLVVTVSIFIHFFLLLLSRFAFLLQSWSLHLKYMCNIWTVKRKLFAYTNSCVISIRIVSIL